MTLKTPPRFKLTPELTAWRAGSGPVMILSHGVGLNADAWLPMLPELAQKFTVIAIDIPGHGGSKCLSTPEPDLGDYTDALATGIEKLDEPALVVGHSMGAQICIDLAIRHPSLVSGVVPLNAIFQRSAEASVLVNARAAEIKSGVKVDPTSPLDRWFGAAPKGDINKARAQCELMLNSVDQRGYAAAYCAFASSNGPQSTDLDASHIPMLFITGSDEPNSTPEMSQQMAKLAPNGHVKIIEGARHMMPMTHAKQVNYAIDIFVTHEVSSHAQI